jgi:hypothetical protein
MSDVEDVDDLEFLRQAALTSLLKKKAEAGSTNAVSYKLGLALESLLKLNEIL